MSRIVLSGKVKIFDMNVNHYRIFSANKKFQGVQTTSVFLSTRFKYRFEKNLTYWEVEKPWILNDSNNYNNEKITLNKLFNEMAIIRMVNGDTNLTNRVFIPFYSLSYEHIKKNANTLDEFYKTDLFNRTVKECRRLNRLFASFKDNRKAFKADFKPELITLFNLLIKIDELFKISDLFWLAYLGVIIQKKHIEKDLVTSYRKGYQQLDEDCLSNFKISSSIDIDNPKIYFNQYLYYDKIDFIYSRKIENLLPRLYEIRKLELDRLVDVYPDGRLTSPSEVDAYVSKVWQKVYSLLNTGFVKERLITGIFKYKNNKRGMSFEKLFPKTKINLEQKDFYKDNQLFELFVTKRHDRFFHIEQMDYYYSGFYHSKFSGTGLNGTSIHSNALNPYNNFTVFLKELFNTENTYGAYSYGSLSSGSGLAFRHKTTTQYSKLNGLFRDIVKHSSHFKNLDLSTLAYTYNNNKSTFYSNYRRFGEEEIDYTNLIRADHDFTKFINFIWNQYSSYPRCKNQILKYSETPNINESLENKDILYKNLLVFYNLDLVGLHINDDKLLDSLLAAELFALIFRSETDYNVTINYDTDYYTKEDIEKLEELDNFSGVLDMLNNYDYELDRLKALYYLTTQKENFEMFTDLQEKFKEVNRKEGELVDTLFNDLFSGEIRESKIDEILGWL